MSRVAAVVVALALMSVPTATAHPWSDWYWATWRAEARLPVDPPFSWKLKHWKVVGGECFGIGRRIWSGEWLYKHHDCEITLYKPVRVCEDFGCYTDYQIELVERILHVTGRRSYVLQTG
jgi:hypothetical protein